MGAALGLMLLLYPASCLVGHGPTLTARYGRGMWAFLGDGY